MGRRVQKLDAWAESLRPKQYACMLVWAQSFPASSPASRAVSLFQGQQAQSRGRSGLEVSSSSMLLPAHWRSDDMGLLLRRWTMREERGSKVESSSSRCCRRRPGGGPVPVR